MAASIEGGGKRRIFAICNYVRQNLLRPDWSMRVLRSIRCDGTFHQERPLAFVKDKTDLFSFDLKSATDRWPLAIVMEVTRLLFGTHFAGAVVVASLGMNMYTVDRPLTKKSYSIYFRAGIPLGYLSSWPLFALSHHVIVWLAAERAL